MVLALRGASNHLMLRWLKTVVVSDEEKAHQMRLDRPGHTRLPGRGMIFGLEG
jgi:hypothetical protein